MMPITDFLSCTEVLDEFESLSPPQRHHAKTYVTGLVAVEFVFIPPYSPTLNAIEPLWKSLKREISPEIYENSDHFRQFLTETFLRLSHRVSFAVDWIDKFLPNIQRLR